MLDSGTSSRFRCRKMELRFQQAGTSSCKSMMRYLCVCVLLRMRMQKWPNRLSCKNLLSCPPQSLCTLHMFLLRVPCMVYPLYHLQMFLPLLPSSLYSLCWTRIFYLCCPAGVFTNTSTFSNFCGTCVEREGARARESERASERERQSERESARESESERARERENKARESVKA